MANKKKSAPAKPKKPSIPRVITGKTKADNPNRPFADIVKAGAGKRLVLHVGCSVYNPMKLHESFRTPEWHEVRLDIDPSVNPDIIADMTDLSMIPDHSVDAIWSSHNVEHLYPHVVPVALKEFFRILKHTGHFLVTLPDIETVAGYVARGMLEDPIYDSPAGPICAIDIMYGLRSAMERGNLFMSHKTAFTAKTLGMHMRDAGFCNIGVTRTSYDLWAKGFKLPVDHPQRVEKITVNGNDQSRLGSLPPVTPLARTPHPGQIRPNMLTDELNIPPRVWQPLGLKK